MVCLIEIWKHISQNYYQLITETEPPTNKNENKNGNDKCLEYDKNILSWEQK